MADVHCRNGSQQLVGIGIVAACLALITAPHTTVAASVNASAEQAGLRGLETAISQLQQLVPTQLEDFSADRTSQIVHSAQIVDRQATNLFETQPRTSSDRLGTIRRLRLAKKRVDENLYATLEWRVEIATRPAGMQRREHIRNFLRMTTAYIDLSGRLNWKLRRSIIGAAYAFASSADLRVQLVDQIANSKCTIGTSLLAPYLVDPPGDSPNKAVPASISVKLRVLDLLGRYGRHAVLPFVVRILKSEQSTPELTILAADTIIRLGLPQSMIPEAEPNDREAQRITAGELRQVLKRVDERQLRARYRQHRNVLLDWLKHQSTYGVGSEGYWSDGVGIKPGDWLLMRNASPYNLFTDISPGLFTHVGVVALHRGVDGVRRLVVVDVNEGRTKITGRNVESVLPQPQYYAVLRHEDPKVAAKMSQIAASLIGNPMQFDLTFDMARVEKLRAQELNGRKITTYCAGLLLICAQETGRPQDEFFPVDESSAGARTTKNLRHIGLRVSESFVSPTGTLFARRMQLIHLSEPMYDPSREIEQRIFDSFANGLETKILSTRQNFFQMLRQKLADASATRPVLAEALAQAAGVASDTDLAAASRAAAVVETLDSIAYGASSDFRDALQAISVSSGNVAAGSQTELKRREQFEKRHHVLLQKLKQRRLSRLELTDILVSYFVERGTRAVERYFFSTRNENHQEQRK